MSLLSLLKKLLPVSLFQWQEQMRKAFFVSRAYRALIMNRKIAGVRKAPVIKVLFIAYSPAMWKADSLYIAMREHPRFEPELLLVPDATLADTEGRSRGMELLRSFFAEKGYHFVEWCDMEGNSVYNRVPREYDIIFYPQPWPGIVPKQLDFVNNLGRLLVGCEYAFHSSNQNWAYNKWYQNAVWLDLYENEVTYQLSCREKDNRGVNSVMTGLPIVDNYNKTEYPSPWKSQPSPCKKIIWAPHWTITEKSSILPSYSHFLEMADFMLSFAEANAGKIQFAFKPHPALKKELYKHPDWGKEKTERYYKAWVDGENTQVEEGESVNLFMTSDAMVHDSSSFCCEYMMTGKPVLFMVKNEELQVSLLNEMSRSAFYAQYLGYSMTDLQQFLDKIVMQSHDPKKEERAAIKARYLTPPHGNTAAENIIKAILGELS